MRWGVGSATHAGLREPELLAYYGLGLALLFDSHDQSALTLQPFHCDLAAVPGTPPRRDLRILDPKTSGRQRTDLADLRCGL